MEGEASKLKGKPLDLLIYIPTLIFVTDCMDRGQKSKSPGTNELRVNPLLLPQQLKGLSICLGLMVIFAGLPFTYYWYSLERL